MTEHFTHPSADQGDLTYDDIQHLVRRGRTERALAVRRAMAATGPALRRLARVLVDKAGRGAQQRGGGLREAS